MRWIHVALALTAALTLPLGARADTIVLSNGREISGRVLRVDDATITLSVADGRGSLVVPRALVAHVGDVAPGTSATRASEVAGSASTERVAGLLAEARGRIKVSSGDRRPPSPYRPAAGDVPGSADRIARILSEAKGHIKVTFDDTARAWPPVNQVPGSGNKTIVPRAEEPSGPPEVLAAEAAPTRLVLAKLLAPDSESESRGEGPDYSQPRPPALEGRAGVGR